ncbi:hypothetical protein ABPG74_019047 [Tetrahymena malaccensis]
MLLNTVLLNLKFILILLSRENAKISRIAILASKGSCINTQSKFYHLSAPYLKPLKFTEQEVMITQTISQSITFSPKEASLRLMEQIKQKDDMIYSKNKTNQALQRIYKSQRCRQDESNQGIIKIYFKKYKQFNCNKNQLNSQIRSRIEMENRNFKIQKTRDLDFKNLNDKQIKKNLALTLSHYLEFEGSSNRQSDQQTSPHHAFSKQNKN